MSTPWSRICLTAGRLRPGRMVSLAAVLAGALIAIAPRPAAASEGISAFTSTSSSSQAGGHPDLETAFELENPGTPEAAKNVVFEAPGGVFGNPEAITRCSSIDFALDQCPSAAQAGLVTVRANYEGNTDDLLGTVPMYDMEPGAHTALFAFIAPILNIPINIPVSVRSAGDYGLRFTVSNISEITPLAAARLTFWGFPAETRHDSQRFAKGSPGNPAGCVGVAGPTCITNPTEAAIPVNPLIDNPTSLYRQRAGYNSPSANLPRSLKLVRSGQLLSGDNGMRR